MPNHGTYLATYLVPHIPDLLTLGLSWRRDDGVAENQKGRRL